MIPTSSPPPPPPSTFPRYKKPILQEEDEIMELLWQNGQVITQSQTQRSVKKLSSITPLPSKYDDAVLPAEQMMTSRDIRLASTSQLHHHQQQQQNLFIQEDEMAAWLHYPLHNTNFVDEDHNDFCADLLYPPSSSSSACVTTAAPDPVAAAASATGLATPSVRTVMNSDPRQQLPVTAISSAATLPPITSARKAEVVQNFAHFSRHRAGTARVPLSQSGPSNSKAVVRESTAVDSSDTPSASTAAARSSAKASSVQIVAAAPLAGTSSGAVQTNRETMTTTTALEMTVTSSPGGSTASAEPHPIPPPPPSSTYRPPAEDRKRKGREKERETEWQSEVSDLISLSLLN